MRIIQKTWMLPVVGLILGACIPSPSAVIRIVDRDQIRYATAAAASVGDALKRTGITLGPDDAILANGYPVAVDSEVLGTSSLTLQIIRARRISINGNPGRTAADTVGAALVESGHTVYAADLLDPVADAEIQDSATITYRPSESIQVEAGGTTVQARTAEAHIGGALADIGLPLVGLDESSPSADAEVPANNHMQLSSITESLLLTQESLPYATSFQESAEIEIGQQRILEPGLNGLAIARTRIRLADGTEVSRLTEGRAVVRPPQDRVVARGTKVVEKNVAVDGASIKYWLKMQMYATVYSPCNSAGGSNGGCSYGTASGLKAGKGVVAVDPSLFAYLNGQRIYVPGYGLAVIGDVGGGYIVEQSLGVSRYKWIDLGFDDNNLQDLTGWVTVYFLAPAPEYIPDVLK